MAKKKKDTFTSKLFKALSGANNVSKNLKQDKIKQASRERSAKKAVSSQGRQSYNVTKNSRSVSNSYLTSKKALGQQQQGSYANKRATQTKRTSNYAKDHQSQNSALYLKQRKAEESKSVNRDLVKSVSNVAGKVGKELSGAVHDYGANVSKKDDVRARQQQKSGIETRNKALGIKESSTGQAIEGTLKQVAGSHLKSFGKDSNEYAQEVKKLTHMKETGRISNETYKANIESLKKSSTKYEKYKGWEDTKYHDFSKKVYAQGDKLNKAGEEQIADAYDGASSLKKAYVGAVSSGIGMATDMTLGPLWATSMFSRTYGGTLGSTRQIGTSEFEDERYAGLMGLKEVATEGMFAGAGVARGLVTGSPISGLSLADKIAAAVTKNISGKKLANFADMTIRVLGGTVEENLEEIAGWALDPIVADIAYGKDMTRKLKIETAKGLQYQRDSLLGDVSKLSPGEISAIGAYLSSGKFTEELAKAYMESGADEKVANKLAKQMKNYLYASLSGNTKEAAKYEGQMVAAITGKNPYAEAWDLDELKDTIASTTLMTMATGIPSAMNTNVMGNAFKNEAGVEGIKSLVKTAINFDDDAMSIKAQAMRERVESGKELTGTQTYELISGLEEQVRVDSDRAIASYQAAQKLITDNEYVSPVTMDNNGDIVMGEKTYEKFEAARNESEKVIKSNKELQLPEEKIDRVTDAIGRFETGAFTVNAAAEFGYTNTEAREVFEKVTGKKLPVVFDKNMVVNIPATNKATKDFLFSEATKNLVESAHVETARFINILKGEVDKEIIGRLGAEGQKALLEITNNVGLKDRARYMTVANIASTFYEAGRNGSLSFEAFNDNVSSKIFDSVDIDTKRKAFEAGREDKANYDNKAQGISVTAGETITFLDESAYAGRGEVINEVTSRPISNSETEVFTSLAHTLGINIHLVDSIGTATNKQANGLYKNGEIWLNVNESTDRNIGYIFMHEVTHHIKAFAPAEFNKLENLVREKWFDNDADGFQQAISNKIERYENDGITLTAEEAIEEIIADSTYEMIQDSEFANRACEDMGLGKSILGSIKNAIRKIRALFVAHEGFEPEYNRALLSQLDILKEAEKLWLNALNQAVKNRNDEQLKALRQDVDKKVAIEEFSKENKFSLNEPVEETRDLIAVHNMKESDLYGMLKLGGLPMPSIAVVKAEAGHDKYGEYSVVFNKNTIDPEKRDNYVYGGDAWTPTFPTIDKKVDIEVANRVSKKVREILGLSSSDFEYHGLRLPASDSNNIKDKLSSTTPYEAYRRDNVMRLAYIIAEKKLSDEVPKKEGHIGGFGESFYKSLAEKVPYKTYDDYYNAPRMEYAEAVREALYDYYASEGMIKGNPYVDSIHFGEYDPVISNLIKYKRDGIPDVVDTKKLDEILDNKVDETGYEKWVDDLFTGIVEKEGIRNNKDMFTPSSWESLHEPVTLKTVVSLMRQEQQQGKGFGSSIMGAGVKTFNSIEDIKANADKLQTMDKEAYGLAKNDIYDRTYALAQEFAKPNSNTMSVADLLAEAVAERKTRNGIANYLKKEGKGWTNYSEEIVDKLIDIVKDVQSIPTEYFEAKPRRAVGFDEIAAIISPDNAPQDLISALKSENINVILYEAGKETDRLLKLNSLEDSKFSLPEDGDSEADKGIYTKNRRSEVDIFSGIADELRATDAMDEWISNNVDDMANIPAYDPVLEEGRVRMAKSKQEFMDSLKLKWNERWLTEGKVLDVKSVKANIRNLIIGAMANSDTDHQYRQDMVDRTMRAAKTMFWLMKEGKYSEAGDLAWDTANIVIKDLKFFEDSGFEDAAKDLTQYFRTTRLTLPKGYERDMVDWNNFRKRNFGRMKLGNNGVSVDIAWMELNEMYPGIFPLDIENPADQLFEIEHVLDMLQPYAVAYDSEEAAAIAGDIASELFDIVQEGKELKSIADTYKNRFDKKTKALKERYKEALREARNQKTEAVKRERLKLKEYKEKQQSAKERAKTFGSIAENYDWLTTRLLNPTKDKNIPEGFKKAMANLLMQLDLQTERSKKLEEQYGVAQKTVKMRELQRQLQDLAKEDNTGTFTYNGFLFTLMDALAQKIDGRSIDSMDSSDMAGVDYLLKSIKHNLDNYNKTVAYEKQQEISKLGDSTISAMKEKIDKFGRRKNRPLGELLNESEETPAYFFERIGGGVGEMYKGLRKGFDQYVRNTMALNERLSGIFGEYFNVKKPGASVVEGWRDSSNAKTFELTHGSITMSPAQIMSLYCLSKRSQAMGHILGNGIVVTPVKKSAQVATRIKETMGGSVEQVASVLLTYEDVRTIVSTLTPEQVKMADDLQSVLNNEMSSWGNETALKLHGVKLFNDENYFPIRSSKEVLAKTAESFDVKEQIRNFGFTKPIVQGANNAIVIDDIVSVVAEHCNKMNLYNAFAAPIADFMKVYNYKQVQENGTQRTVQQMIGEAYTNKANKYIMHFMADLNGSTKTRSEAVNDLFSRSLANYKRASIGMNLRVLAQQPTAIVRALIEMHPKYFIGLAPTMSAYKEMIQHCPIAWWKAQGNYQIDMSRDVEDIMLNTSWSKWDTISMGSYGFADNATWSVIWQAIKKEVRENNPNMEYDSEEFLNACGDRASVVFDKTQVVDSVFHRSDAMRSKNSLTRMATSFMAEPTLTYNVMRSSLVEAYEQYQIGDKNGSIKTLSKMMTVLVLNAAATSAAAALVDVLRGKGDDKEKELRSVWERWFSNFLNNFEDNFNPLNNIYFVKDIYSLKDGWGTSNMAIEGWATTIQALNDMKKKLNGDSKKSWIEILEGLADGIGYVTGYPIRSMRRDITAILEKTGLITEASAEDGEEEKIKFFDYERNPIDVQDGSPFDNFLNKIGINLTAEEREERDFNKQLAAIEKKTSMYGGEEKNEKIWEMVSDGYTKRIERGDIGYVKNMLKLIEAAGGDVNTAKAKVLRATTAAYKKTIGSDKPAQQEALREFLLESGVTEQYISSEIVYKSATAKDLAYVLKIWDEDAIITELRTLREAGFTYEDFCRLYENRNRYSNYTGKYVQNMGSTTGTFVWPTQGVIASGYGPRTAPTAGASSYHEAIDIGAQAGTSVVASDGGTVVSAGWHGGYGYSVIIQHGNGMKTYYNHLQDYSVQAGESVAKGSHIASVGSTGVSTGPHLDFRVSDSSGKFVNPLEYLKAQR